MTCQKYERPVLKAQDVLTNTIYLYQPRCKMWDCPDCAKTNKLLWQARIGYGYEWYNEHGVTNWQFLTITSSDKNKNAEQCLYVFPDAWAKLSARMRRKFQGVRYVILPEHHADGRVHWHLIASHGITTRWLKDNAPYCGFGYMQQAEPIRDNWKAIFYVSKYLGKSLGVEEWPKKLKRISTSQKWPELPPEGDFEPLELDWTYLTIYPAEGLDYLAEGIAGKTGCKVKVLK